MEGKEQESGSEAGRDVGEVGGLLGTFCGKTGLGLTLTS